MAEAECDVIEARAGHRIASAHFQRSEGVGALRSDQLESAVERPDRGRVEQQLVREVELVALKRGIHIGRALGEMRVARVYGDNLSAHGLPLLATNLTEKQYRKS